AAMRAVVLRHDHEPARVLVETVDYSRPLFPADAGEASAATGDQGVDQRAAPIAGRGMHDKPARFVDDNDVVILVNDVERYGFGARLGRRRRRNVDADGGGAIDP